MLSIARIVSCRDRLVFIGGFAVVVMTLAGTVGCERHPELTSSAGVPGESMETTIVYFFSPGCPECAEIDRTVVPLLEDLDLTVVKVNVNEDEGTRRLLEVESRYGVEFKTLAPNMLFGDRVLIGADGIRQEFLGEG